MKNTKKHVCIGIVTLITIGLQSAYSGTMGNINTCNSCSTPFGAIEGSLTWVKYKSSDSGNFTISTPVLQAGSVNTSDNANVGGGRLSGGLAHHYTPSVDLTAEAGINYFGKISTKTTGNTAINFKLNSSLSGMDILLGAAYKNPRFHQIEWFGKAGGLIVNTNIKTTLADLPILLIDNGVYSYGGSSSSTKVDFLPEIKVGINYDFSTKLAITLAYMYAFGSSKVPTVNGSLTQDAQGNTLLHMDTRSRIPSLNAALLGLRYNFA